MIKRRRDLVSEIKIQENLIFTLKQKINEQDTYLDLIISKLKKQQEDFEVLAKIYYG
jgi:hypothetical protein